MPTLICNATSTLTGAATFAAAETGALALNLVRNTTASLATAATVTSATFTVTNAKVIDGALLWLKTAGTTGTGTFKVDLQKGGVSQASVTVNKSDLPDSTNAIACPVFFKFTGTATGDGGANWTIVLTTVSGTGTATITYNINAAGATNLTRALRTTTAATAAATDDLYIVGELTGAGTNTARTVTMDQTATTAYGNGTVNSTTVSGGLIAISNYGTLTYDNTINSVLRVNGDLIVYQNGALNIGTTSGSAEIPRNKTAVLEFQQTSADLDFGLRLLDNSVTNIAGLSRTSGKNIVKCKLAANASASGIAPSTSSLTVDTDTGWLNGDIVAIASTTRTPGDCEFGTLTGGDAGASSFTVNNMAAASAGEAIPPTSNRGLLVAHLGTAPTQAEIGLLTRNVRIRSTSTTLMSYVYCTALATVTIQWAEFYYIGTNSSLKRGINIDCGTTTNAKSITYCSIHTTEFGGLYTDATNTSLNLTFSNNVLWNANSAVTINGSITNTNHTFDNNLVIKSSGYGFLFVDVGGTYTNNTAAGCTTFGFELNESSTPIGSFSGNTSHSNTSYGFINAANSLVGAINNLTCWRNGDLGVYLNGANDVFLTFDGLTLFGNTTANFMVNDVCNLTITNSTIAADTSFATTSGFYFNFRGPAIIDASTIDMSGSGTGLAVHTNDFLFQTGTYVPQFVFANSKFGGTNLITNRTNWTGNSAYISFEKFGQTAGDHRTEMLVGQLKTDTVTFNTASPSMRMTPTSATIKLESAPRRLGILVAVSSGSTVTATVFIRKDAAYNGNQPRLIVRSNAAMGVTSDTVLATYSAGTGSWASISGTTVAATDDGAFEFIVDCDGTAGYINVDDWSVA